MFVLRLVFYGLIRPLGTPLLIPILLVLLLLAYIVLWSCHVWRLAKGKPGLFEEVY